MKFSLSSPIPAAIRLLTCCFFATLLQPALAQPTSTPQSPAFLQTTPRPPAHSQPTAQPPASITLLTTGPKTSLRGLSAPTDMIIWASGSKGTVGRSTDGGTTWTWITVPGYEKRDFRDIEAFDANTAVIMAIDTPAHILKTTDGGKTWKLVYENKTPGMFLDAMEFSGKTNGIVVGDPVHGRFFIARTADGGETWHETPGAEPKADSGEGCFASSGTNIRFLDPISAHGPSQSSAPAGEACFVSGGPSSHLFIQNNPIVLPILQGKTSTGANSVAVKQQSTPNGDKELIVVGGDFAKDTSQKLNCFLTHDGGKTWIAPSTPPHGYRSCVEFIGGAKVLACGTSGVDISYDNGMNWQLITTTGFHVCRIAQNGQSVFLAGSGGRIARLDL
jgi:hypothetical protein